MNIASYIQPHKKSAKFHNLIIIIVYCWCNFLTGQTKSTSEIISQSINQQNKSIYNQYINDVSKLDFSIPLIERIDVRTEIDRLTSSRQEFMLRTNFNSHEESTANIKKQQSYIEWKSYNLMEEQNNAIFLRYNDLIKWKYWVDDLDNHLNLKKILEAKLAVAKEQMTAGISFDLDDYVKIETDLLFWEEKLTTIQNSISSIKNKFDCDSVIYDQWITTDLAKAVIENNDYPLAIDFKTSLFEKESEYLSNSILLEKAKNNKILDFAQAKFTLRDDLLLQNRFTVGLGINIPWRGSERSNISNIKLKEVELEAEKADYILNIKVKIDSEIELFKLRVNQLQKLNSIKQNVELKELKDRIISSGRMEPLKILKLKEDEVALSSRINKLTFEIMESYIKILDLSSAIYSKPYINYLNSNLELIQK